LKGPYTLTDAASLPIPGLSTYSIAARDVPVLFRINHAPKPEATCRAVFRCGVTGNSGKKLRRITEKR
jgi:hypothetical protein